MSEKTLFQFWWYTYTCSTCTGTGTGSTCTVGTTATGTEVQVTYDRYSCRTYKHIIHADCRYLHSDVHCLFFLTFFFTFLITPWSYSVPIPLVMPPALMECRTDLLSGPEGFNSFWLGLLRRRVPLAVEALLTTFFLLFGERLLMPLPARANIFCTEPFIRPPPLYANLPMCSKCPRYIFQSLAAILLS